MRVKRAAKIGVVLGGCLLLAAGVVGHLFFFPSGYAAPIESFNKLTVGMTASQVLQIMGPPDHIRHDTTNSTAFYYGGLGRLKWCIMEVYFGADGQVTGKFHDD